MIWWPLLIPAVAAGLTLGLALALYALLQGDDDDAD